MKILVDLQGLQGGSKHRGIGRYSLEFVAALNRAMPQAQLIALFHSCPSPTSGHEVRALHDYLPNAQFARFDAPWPWQFDTNSLHAHKSAERFRDDAIRRLRPDLVLVTSLFEGPDSSVISIPEADQRPPTAVIGYDLLPLVDHSCRPGTADAQAFYSHRLASLTRADKILTISQHTATDMVNAAGLNARKVINVGGAAFGLPEPDITSRSGILCTGGDHPRKNEESTIRAYAQLPAKLRAAHALTLVGKYSPDRHDLLTRVAAEAGLDPAEWDFAGWLTDQELADAYANAQLVTFPSRAEGLGMPPLEAWALGTPAIAANRTSLPEVFGDTEYLFDPDNIAAQGQLMLTLLSDNSSWQRALEWGSSREQLWTWDAVGAKAAAVLAGMLSNESETPSDRHDHALGAGSKRSLAFVTPWPPASTGVAGHAEALIPALAEHYDVTLVPDAGSAEFGVVPSASPTITSFEFSKRWSEFDRVLLNLGNSPFHRSALDLAIRTPAVSIVHDVSMAGTLNLLLGDAPAAIDRYKDRGAISIVELPTDPSLEELRNGLGTITHSEHAKNLLTTGSAVALPRDLVATVPLLRMGSDLPDRAEARTKLGVPEGQVLICSFGRIDPSKNTHLAIKSIGLLEEAQSRAHLAVVGIAVNSDYFDECEELSSELPVTLTGEVDRSDYRLWLAACDIAVQLRGEDHGETSAALIDVLTAGRATIIQDCGSFSEFAGDGIILLPRSATSQDVAQALKPLILDSVLRERMGEAVRARVLARHSPGHVASQYFRAIEDFYERYKKRIQPHQASEVARAGQLPSIYLDMVPAERFEGRDQQRISLALVRESLTVGGHSPFPVAQAGPGFVHLPTLTNTRLGPWPPDPIEPIPPVALTGTEGSILLSTRSLLTSEARQHWAAAVSRLKDRECKYMHVLTDLMPIADPDGFDAAVVSDFEASLMLISEHADVILAVSGAAAVTFHSFIEQNPPNRQTKLTVETLAPGYDFANSGVYPTALRNRLPRPTTDRNVLVVRRDWDRGSFVALLHTWERLAEQGLDFELLVLNDEAALGTVSDDNPMAPLPESAAISWTRQPGEIDRRILYLKAGILLCPSNGAASGVSVTDALANGVHVLAGDNAANRQLLGHDACYYSLLESLPTNLQTCRNHIGRSATHSGLTTWRGSYEAILDAAARLSTTKPSG